MKSPTTVAEVIDLASQPDWTPPDVLALYGSIKSPDDRVSLAAIMAIWRLDRGKPIDKADFAPLLEDAAA